MTKFADILRARAQDDPDACAFAFLAADRSEIRLTYSQLERRARALAALLQQKGAAGERVLILLPVGLDYLVAIFGCLLAGSTMVPCALPPRVGRASPLRAIAIDSGARFAVGFPASIKDLEFPHLEWIAPDTATDGDAIDWHDAGADAADVALLQYTSGSTASPRGVMVTHANLLTNAQFIAEGFRHPKGAWGATWLPPWHDMGLIGGLLQSVYCHAPSVVITPMDFVRQPVLWLEAISRYQVRSSGGPNFAYELCARSVKSEEISSLDLKCWELAYVGAEPVRAETLELFVSKFGPCGFRPEFFFPCYGLAEATLYVSGGRPTIARVSAAGLREHRVLPKYGEDVDARQIVGCGQTASSLKVRIVDPRTQQTCAAGSIGEIWVAGPTVASGYWNMPEETEATFRARVRGEDEGPFLRTGDLGFLQGGELFVTGRSKDLMIIRGRNYYPQDIENTVAAVSPAFRAGSYAAFSVESGSEEKLVLILEMPRPRPENPEMLAGDIRQAIVRDHELQLSSIVLVRPGAIPRTSSGKVQRLECRTQYLSGALEGLAV